MRLKWLLLTLAALAPPAGAASDVEKVLATPACLLGMDNAQAVKRCTERVPELGEPLREAHDGWKARNAQALELLSSRCEARLATLYRDLGLGGDGIERLHRAAQRLMDSMRASSAQDEAPLRCEQLKSALAMHTLTLEDAAESAQIPLTLAFMAQVDPDFLREPPAIVAANYQRDRGLHYAQSYGRFSALRTGTAYLLVNCLSATLEECERRHGPTLGPAGELKRRERLSTGEEKVTFVGKKMLFRGSFSDNHPAGLEERVFLLRPDGRISDAWERVQLLEPGFAERELPPAFRCERYGRATAGPCRVRSVD